MGFMGASAVARMLPMLSLANWMRPSIGSLSAPPPYKLATCPSAPHLLRTAAEMGLAEPRGDLTAGALLGDRLPNHQ